MNDKQNPVATIEEIGENLEKILEEILSMLERDQLDRTMIEKKTHRALQNAIAINGLLRNTKQI